MNRLPHLDWLRGIAVLIMIEAHTLDSWTRVADKKSAVYQWATIVAGFGAPYFLFLAGVALMLAAGARQRRGLAVFEVTRLALRRGAWILALAFLFRLQSFLISGGTFPRSLLKVDILNIMGVSMLAGSVGLAVATTFTRRVLVFVAVTVAVAMATPLIRTTPLLDGLPDSLEAYLRPRPGFTTFTLFPWAAFFTAGCVIGAWLDSRPGDVPRTHWRLAAIGVAVGLGGYAASFLPPLYPEVSFWTSSPTFFFLRLGILMTSVPLAYVLSRAWKGAALQQFGRDSLFVYWIHVELVYGVLSAPIHRRLPLALAMAAFVAFSLGMFGLVRLKTAVQGRPTKTPAIGSSSLPAGGNVSSNSI